MVNERLQKLAENVRIGGKGTPRRKVKKQSAKSAQLDDKKINSAMKKINCQPVYGTDEINFFKNDETVLHFESPKLLASIASNVFVIQGGNPQSKGSISILFLDITELAPGIIEQLSPESLNKLREMANAYIHMSKKGVPAYQ